MKKKEPLSGLQVIAVRYRGIRLAENDERALDAYEQSKVYGTAGLPVEIDEPKYPADADHGLLPDNLGLFNGIIADKVASACRDGKGVLMTGGDCTHLTGVVGGLQLGHGAETRIGLVFFDAHGDFNTPQTTISGSLGGMPVAVCAGLAYPSWREGAKIQSPIPTDRIVMVGLRNLDPAEDRLIQAVGITKAAVAPGFPGVDLQEAVTDMAGRCDLIYLHIDADILDERFTLDHGTREPNGPTIDQVREAVSFVMSTGKVKAYAVVSVYAGGPNREPSIAAGIDLIEAGLKGWKREDANSYG